MQNPLQMLIQPTAGIGYVKIASKPLSLPKQRLAVTFFSGLLWMTALLLSHTTLQAQSFSWARNVTGTYLKTKILVLPNGNYFVAGEYTGELKIGNFVNCPAGGKDVFVAYFDGATGDPNWVKRIAGPEDDLIGGLSYTDGRLYITGSFRGKAIVDNFRTNDPNEPCTSFLSKTIHSNGKSDIFIVRYYVWSGALHLAASAGGPGDDAGLGIKAIGSDDNTNVFLTGYFSKKAEFTSLNGLDQISKTTTVNGEQTYRDGVLARYKIAKDATTYPAFNLQWAKRVGVGAGDDYGTALDLDNSGNVYLTGGFTHQMVFNSNPAQYFTTLKTDLPQGLGNSDMFVAKFNSSGNYLWANKAGGTGWDVGNDLAVDGTGNVYVAGSHLSTTAIFHRNASNTSQPLISLPSAGNQDGFLAAYNSSGYVQWVNSLGGAKSDNLTGVVRDNAGNLYVTGFFNDKAKASGKEGNKHLAAANATDQDVVVVKYKPNGGIIWHLTGGGASFNQAHDIGVDQKGSAYISGDTGPNAAFGAQKLTKYGNFVAKVNPPLDKIGFRIDAEAAAQSAESPALVAYPVPTSDQVTVEFTPTVTEATSVTVYDLKGTLTTTLFEGEAEAGKQYQLVLDASQYTPGMYIVKVASLTQSHHTKISVVR
jgi:hypothetical protein